MAARIYHLQQSGMEASGLTLRLEAWCATEGFPLSGRHLLCAVSGGVDSMVLLELLRRLRERGEITLTAATFDHGIRPAAREDAAFVVRWCEEHHIPCHSGRGDVPAYARERGETLEQAARTLRYRFLESCAREAGADYIATAHNADDNAETLLLHLLRGSGLKGLGGIPPRRGQIVRPLLWMTRQEIAAFAARSAIPFREDESNADTAFTRNFLRHEVMPLLRQCNPRAVQTLSAAARSLRQDEDCLAALTEQAARACSDSTVEAERLRALPPALSLRLIQTLAERAGSPVVLSRSQREAVLALAEGENPSGELSLSGGLIAWRRYDKLSLEVRREPSFKFSPVTLGDGEETWIPALGLWMCCRRVDRFQGEQPGRLALAGVGEEITLRPRQSGDVIHLPGRGSKRLKKWMIEERVPREERERIPVIQIGDRLAAVWGMGRDRDFLPRQGGPAWELWTIDADRKEKQP